MRKATAQLNKKELTILRALADGPETLAGMARRFRAAKAVRAANDAQAHSWARNSVRKPVRLGLLRKFKRGVYGLTAKGRAIVEAAA